MTNKEQKCLRKGPYSQTAWRGPICECKGCVEWREARYRQRVDALTRRGLNGTTVLKDMRVLKYE